MKKQHNSQESLHRKYSELSISELERMSKDKGYSLMINPDALISEEDYYLAYKNNILLSLSNCLCKELHSMSNDDIVMLEVLSIKKEIVTKYFLSTNKLLTKETIVKENLTINDIINNIRHLNIKKQMIKEYLPNLLTA